MRELTVTIIVLSYNAASTIIETLESIRAQDYNGLSLLIGDDASKDDTVDIVNRWIKSNRDRFVDCKVICRSGNIGTSKNFDDLMKMVNTRWVKIIAADDILVCNCIRKNVDYVMNNKVEAILYSRIRPFKVVESKKEYLPECQSDIKYIKKLSTQKVNKQYESLLKQDIVFSPAGFINAEIYKKLGGIDTRIRNIEDWPLRLLFTSNGYKIDFMDEVTVYYRIGESVSHSQGCFFNPNHIKQRQYLKRLLIYPNIPKWKIAYYWDEIINNFRYKIIIHVFNNKVNRISKVVNYMLMILSPRAWRKMIKQKT